MTEIDDQPDRDPAISSAYRRTRTAEPAAAIDAAVLAASRQAVAVAHRPPPGSPWRQWTAAAGLAFTVVLAIMVALVLDREPAEPTSERTPSRHGESSVPENAAAAPDVKPSMKPTSPRPAAAPTMGNSATDRRRSAEQPFDLRPDRRAQPPAGHADAAGDQGLGQQEPAAAAPPSPTSSAVSGAAAGRPAAAMGIGDMEKSRSAGRLAGGAGAGRLSRDESAAARPPAAAWLEKIRHLRLAGRHDEAAAELAAFRIAYPGHTVPDDLTAP